MTFGQPPVMPWLRRQTHTSSSSCFHSVGNSDDVVAAATTAVGRASTVVTSAS